MLVCAGACVCVCVCMSAYMHAYVCVCVCVYALRIVSRDKILCFKNTFIIIIIIIIMCLSYQLFWFDLYVPLTIVCVCCTFKQTFACALMTWVAPSWVRLEDWPLNTKHHLATAFDMVHVNW